MSNINMNWKSDGFTVYALNEQDVNDFSFHVQGNGRKGYDPKSLQEVASMAEAAPDMYLALREVTEWLGEIIGCEEEAEMHVKCEQALAKARGEV